MRDQVFISYSRRDAHWLERLQVHLAPFERRGRVRRWDDTLIAPGARWESAIHEALDNAAVAVLLVSADFLASHFIGSVELPRLLGAADDQGVRVIPLVIGHCNFDRFPELAQFNAIHPVSAPLETLAPPEQERVLAKLAAAVADVLGALDATGSGTPGAVPLPVPARLVGLPARNPLFCGRGAVFDALDARLATGRRAALCGFPGLGKSEALIEFAHRRRNAWASIYWCRADSPQQLIFSFVAIAAALRLPEAAGADQPAAARAALAALSQQSGWLLLLDGAEDAASLREWIPASAGAPGSGSVLLASRSAATGAVADPVELDALDEPDAVTFLLRRARLAADGEAIPLEQQPAARRIVQAAAGVPLALDQAGAYIEEIGCSLDEYEALWRSHRRDLLAQRGSGGLRGDDSLWQAWSLSLAQLEAASPAGAALLRLLAFFHTEALPDAALAAGAAQAGLDLGPVLGDALKRNAALREVLRFAFLRRDAKSRRLRMHPMVQAFVRDSLVPAEAAAWSARAVAVIDAVFPEPRFANWAECDLLAPHAAAAIDAAASLAGLPAGTDPAGGGARPAAALARLAAELGFYLVQRVRHAEAAPLIEGALATQRTLPLETAADRERLARTLMIAARLDTDRARYDDGIALLHEARALLEALPPSVALVHVLDRIATAEVDRGDHASAASWFERARAVIDAAGAARSVEAAQVCNDLGTLHFAQGRFAEAAAAFEQAGALRRELLPPAHPGRWQSLHNEAAVRARLGERERARELYLETLALREAALGPEHPHVADTLLNLGLLDLNDGRLHAARAALERARAIRTGRRGPDHPEVASVRVALARLDLAEGRPGAALAEFEAVRDLRARLLGPRHEDVGRAWLRIADAHQALGDADAVHAALLEAESILHERLGPTHPERMECVARLGRSVPPSGP